MLSSPQRVNSSVTICHKPLYIKVRQMEGSKKCVTSLMNDSLRLLRNIIHTLTYTRVQIILTLENPILTQSFLDEANLSLHPRLIWRKSS